MANRIPMVHHGSAPRGFSFAPSSKTFEGRFGRLFRELEGARFRRADLELLAKTMTRASEPFDRKLGEDDPDENKQVGPDGKTTLLPAGYTYFGQFIDHDITFDPASSLERQNDPDALIDFRTPRLDLDSLYGRGPADQPYMYDAKGHLLVGQTVSSHAEFAGPDLPRAANGRAIIGDPRNDENKIVSQLHSLMIRFHNRAVDLLSDFEAAQQMVRWHYQWIVLHDFLPRISGKDVVYAVLNRPPPGEHVDHAHAPWKPNLGFYRPRKDAFMPVEFSVAAYRFGHSMVRPSYLINDVIPAPRPLHRIPIFSPDGPTTNLNSFDVLPKEWGIQWGFFFDLREDPNLPQPSYKIDEKVASPLGNLPPSVAVDPSSLALRNLIRGESMGLPSGEDVARFMGLTPLADVELFPTLDLRQRFSGKTPLWYYILRESSVRTGGRHLGPVGGRIVAEVLIGLLWHDAQSFLRKDPNWTPTFAAAETPWKFEMADLVRFARAPT